MKNLYRLLRATAASEWRNYSRLFFLALLLASSPLQVLARKPSRVSAPSQMREASALLLSDIHFDAFQYHYVQYVAPSTGDIETAWSHASSFREAYQEPSFSAAALEDLFTCFGAYTSQSCDQASRYIERYSSGTPKYEIAPVWNSYRCVLRSMTADQFLNCACLATEPSRGRK